MSKRDILTVKFGGTSMGNRDSILRVMEIISGLRDENCVVTVVSAMGGVTNSLLDIGQMAMAGNRSTVGALLERLQKLHEQDFLSLAKNPGSKSWIKRFIAVNMGEIKSLAEGIMLLHEFSDRTRDKLLSYGEILSSNLLARVMHDRDVAFCHCDARRWLEADWSAQGCLVDMAKSEKQGRRCLLPLIRKGLSPIIPRNSSICST